MNSREYLLPIIVALCLGHVLCRGIETEQKKVFSVKLEVKHHQLDCIRRLRGNVSTNGCEVDLFATKEVQIQNLDDMLYIMPIEIGTPKQKFKVSVGSKVSWYYTGDSAHYSYRLIGLECNSIYSLACDISVNKFSTKLCQTPSEEHQPIKRVNQIQ